jgi:hypothetical protein
MASSNASRGANDEAAALGQPVAAARGAALAWGISRNILMVRELVRRILVRAEPPCRFIHRARLAALEICR